MRGVANDICGELRGKHSGERNLRWIGRIQWFLQRKCWVWSPIGSLIIVQNSAPSKRFRDLDFTDRLRIVKVDIPPNRRKAGIWA